MAYNMRKHELLGLSLVFVGTALIGLTLLNSLLVAVTVNQGMLPPQGLQKMLIPILYGIGATILMLGVIELRDVLPGKNRR